ncbi:MAG: arsenate reductase ArsC [Nitrosopumilus sp.]|nr:arsenate reductase ArsC [Nitrosopumilus sp.]MDH3854428.1 arsenate reductase ArsC [Nitrosopumilus sp.]
MKKILFVCVENAGRSQMAEAFFKKYLPSGFQPISAGTKPAAKVNPIVVQTMKEIGIDIDNKSPQNISQQMIDEAQISVNMGCMDKESCPALFLKDVIDWQIQDPKGKSIKEVREIRDKIEQKVKDFIDFVTESESIGG